MYVFVATSETQGAEPDDYFHAIEGELVAPRPADCDCPNCGCEPELAGITSQRPTTTVRVVERDDLDFRSYRDLLIKDAMASCPGWVPDDDDEWLDELEEFVSSPDSYGTVFGVDSVVGRSRRTGRWDVRVVGGGGAWDEIGKRFGN